MPRSHQTRRFRVDHRRPFGSRYRHRRPRPRPQSSCPVRSPLPRLLGPLPPAPTNRMTRKTHSARCCSMQAHQGGHWRGQYLVVFSFKDKTSSGSLDTNLLGQLSVALVHLFLLFTFLALDTNQLINQIKVSNHCTNVSAHKRPRATHLRSRGPEASLRFLPSVSLIKMLGLFSFVKQK